MIKKSKIHKWILIEIFLFFALGLEQCPPSEEPQASVTGGGWFFGECLGMCLGDLLISDTQVDYVISNWDETVYLDNHGSLPETGEKKARELAQDLVGTDLKSVYGCPDCADGGGFYVSLDREGDDSTHTYEYSDPPRELTEVDRFVRSLMDSLETCLPSVNITPDENCVPRNRS